MHSLRDRSAELSRLLAGDLDFHDAAPMVPAHALHPFPAKFPPQLPAAFVAALTRPGDVVLDPMCGSGTTPLATARLGRRALGFDIDPLAILLGRVKVGMLAADSAQATGLRLADRAARAVERRPEAIAAAMGRRWRGQTRRFVDYWFAPRTQRELLALMLEIERLPDPAQRRFLQVAFSSTIIARSRGVSLALDLAHTRPHRAHRAISPEGDLLFEAPPTGRQGRRQTKTIYPAIEEFRRRVRVNAERLLTEPLAPPPTLAPGNARRLPLPANSVDLVVTSPPYAGNAIDYMRAHKYSLVWMGYGVLELGQRRKRYVGDDSLAGIETGDLPARAAAVVADITARDARRGRVLHRYFWEMTQVLGELRRVLKPGAAAVLVVGSNVMRGRDTETHHCLADIATHLGFDLVGMGERRLKRDRRMMPATADPDLESPIQRRMHREYVIGLVR